jgi:hypothetical protein
MKEFALFLAVGLCACSKQAEPAAQQAKPPAVVAPAASQPTIPASLAAARASVLPIPADKKQLERLLAMGYTRHEDHLHPPGMKQCPFNMGGSMVQ